MAKHVRLWLEVLEDRTAPAILTVNSNDDTVSGTTTTLDLREAILLVNSGGTATDSSGNSMAAAKASQIDSSNGWGNGTIQFDSSLANDTITLTPTQGPLELSGTGGKITINGSSLSPSVVISGGNATRVFQVDTGVQAELDDLIIENGTVANENGGGIFNAGALAVHDCILSDNLASGYYNPYGRGSAIFNDSGGTLTVNGSQFTANYAGVGGSIYNNTSGAVKISGSTISDNYAAFGGGIYNSAGSVTITSTNLSGNRAAYGGAIETERGTLTIMDSTLSSNSADYAGAIDNNSDGTLTIMDTTLSNNSGVAGGAIGNSGTLTITDSTLANNSAPGVAGRPFVEPSGAISGAGGAIYNDALLYNGEKVTISGSTLSGNSAGSNYLGDGGAIFNGEGMLTIMDSALSDNTASTGGAVFNGYDSGVGGNVFVYSPNFSATLNITGSTLSGNSATGQGGAIANWEPPPCCGNPIPVTTIGGSTVTGNHSGDEGGGISNLDLGTLAVSGSTVTDNSAAYDGGGIYDGPFGGIGDLGTSAIVSGSTVSGNTAGRSGGGIYDGGTVTVQKDDALDFYTGSIPDINSAVVGNFAPSGLGPDVEKLGILNVIQSAVQAVDTPASPTSFIFPPPFGTATALTALASSSVTGQEVFSVQVLASDAQGNPITPTGVVKLYDGNNPVPLDTERLDSNGRATFAGALDVGRHPLVHAVYLGDGTFSGSTSAPVIQTVYPVYDLTLPNPSQNLEAAIAAQLQANPSATTITLNAYDNTSAQNAANAMDQVAAPLDVNGNPVPVTINLNLDFPKSTQLTLGTNDPNVTLELNGTLVNGTVTVDPTVPALVVTGGNVIVKNVTFTESGDAPTILVTGGHLTLRNDIVQESTGYNDAAIEVMGGSLDLGTAASPGGNTINVNGAGRPILNVGPNLITALGNSFQVNGSTVFPLTTTTLASSANPSLPNQPITFTATVRTSTAGTGTPTGNVIFVDTTTGTTLGTVALSGGSAGWTGTTLGLGAHAILAVYSGDGNFITSAATLEENVKYGFSGLLPPLNSNLAFGPGRTVPIKFQLTNYNGYVGSLAAVTSLQVLNAQGTSVLTNTGGTALRYDPTANQFVANWQTKGLTAGTYTVQLVLADGTVQTKTIQLTAKGNGANAQAADGSDVSGGGTAGQLLGGDLEVYVDNSNGDLTPDELARIQDAVTAVDAVTEPYGVTVEETTDPSQAEVTLEMAATSTVGGYADGILGCFDPAAGQVTLIQGWDWYAGSDPTQIGSGQYDFQTTVTHELGHALGLGESDDPASAMYGTLAPGTAIRTLTTADLNVPYDEAGADAQRAMPMTATAGSAPLQEMREGGPVLQRIPASATGSATGHPINVTSQELFFLPGAVGSSSARNGSTALNTQETALAPAEPVAPSVTAGGARTFLPAAHGAGAAAPAAFTLPDSPEPAEQAPTPAAMASTSPEERGDPRPAAVDEFFQPVGRWAAGPIRPATDEGKADGPTPQGLAAGGPVLFVLLGASWAAQAEEPESRKHRRQRHG